MNENMQIVDPVITAKKFDDQVQKFRAVEQRYRNKGIVCTRIEFPDFYFSFCATKLQPTPIIFSIKINFSNYDLEPPSIVFVDTFSLKPLKREEVHINFLQFSNPFQPQDLLQGMGSIPPFFCIPGVREYHNHPAHSGDSWFLYRKKGEGTLLFLLDQLYNHSIATITGYIMNNAATVVQLNQQFQIPKVNVDFGPVMNILPNVNLNIG